MRIDRVAAATAVCAALALPAVTATADTAAAPGDIAASASCRKADPYKAHVTSAITIRSKVPSKATVVGALYRSHKFTVHKKTKTVSWDHITDKETGGTG
ncbi:SH3 domain-containing protein [Streptomyces sp. NBUL23]|uniref:SH3 domain-containing protein n=1 Tax=Streptomyces sp. NBUL23 TaxID=3381354 RepID=UPI003871B2A0